MKANDCFAMDKTNRMFTLPQDRGKPKEQATCYVLHDAEFQKYKELGVCGTKLCLFYKKSRSHIRLDRVDKVIEITEREE